jgi:DNA polymerase-3 subunit delta'
MESFESFIGNEEIKKGIARALADDRLPQSLLFFGPEGVGKKTFAILLAREIVCGGAGARPCGPYPSSLKPLAPHPDIKLTTINDKKKRSITIDDIRRLIKENSLKPFMGSKKVFIIDQADRMTPEAANAFLKVLEEPSPTSYLILITAKYLSLLPTIRSRCQLYRFKPLPPAVLSRLLKEKWGKGEEEAEEMAHIAQGRIGTALSLNLAESKKKRADVLSLLSRLISAHCPAERLDLACELAAGEREEMMEKIALLEEIVRDIILLTESGEKKLLVNSKERKIEKLAEKIGKRGSDVFLKLEEAGKKLSANVNQRYLARELVLAISADIKG